MATGTPLLRGFVVLVVDDDADSLATAAMLIEGFGCSVLRAASGSEALAVLDSGAHVDLLFSDVVMPKGNGLALTHAVRERRPELLGGARDRLRGRRRLGQRRGGHPVDQALFDGAARSGARRAVARCARPSALTNGALRGSRKARALLLLSRRSASAQKHDHGAAAAGMARGLAIGEHVVPLR